MAFPSQHPSSEPERADQLANAGHQAPRRHTEPTADSSPPGPGATPGPPGHPTPPGDSTGFAPPGHAAVDPSQQIGSAVPGATPTQDAAWVPAPAPLPGIPGEPAPVPQFGNGSSAPPRNRTVLVLAITTALFFILSATMTGLYLSKGSDLDAANRDIKDLRIALKDSREALRDNKAELRNSEAANRALSRCVDEVTKMIDKVERNGRADARKAFDACDRARPYIADD